MALLRRFIRNDLADLHRSNVRVRVIGERKNSTTISRASSKKLKASPAPIPASCSWSRSTTAPARRLRAPRAGSLRTLRPVGCVPRRLLRICWPSPRYVRPARPRLGDPHQRGTAFVEFSALAGRLQRAGIRAGLWPDLTGRRLRARSPNIGRASPASAGLPRATPRDGGQRTSRRAARIVPTTASRSGWRRASSSRRRHSLSRGFGGAIFVAFWAAAALLIAWNGRSSSLRQSWALARGRRALRRGHLARAPDAARRRRLRVPGDCVSVCDRVDDRHHGVLVGRAVGGRKVWPAISPNKTWSGAIGGVAGALVAGLGVATWGALPLVPNAILAMILSMVARAGSLGVSNQT